MGDREAGSQRRPKPREGTPRSFLEEVGPELVWELKSPSHPSVASLLPAPDPLTDSVAGTRLVITCTSCLPQHNGVDQGQLIATGLLSWHRNMSEPIRFIHSFIYSPLYTLRLWACHKVTEAQRDKREEEERDREQDATSRATSGPNNLSSCEPLSKEPEQASASPAISQPRAARVSGLQLGWPAAGAQAL